MSGRRLPSGHLPGVHRGLCAAVRPHLVFHASRRHVDFCRTDAALCRA